VHRTRPHYAQAEDAPGLPGPGLGVAIYGRGSEVTAPAIGPTLGVGSPPFQLELDFFINIPVGVSIPVDLQLLVRERPPYLIQETRARPGLQGEKNTCDYGASDSSALGWDFAGVSIKA